MKIVRILAVCFGILLGNQAPFGQIINPSGQPRDPNNPLPEWVYRTEEKRRQTEILRGKKPNGMMTPAPDSNVGYPIPSAERRAEIAENLKNTAEINKMLLAPRDYYVKYAKVLKDKNWKLARLFVDKKCDEGKTVKIEEIERCADVIPVKGGGSFYSFRFQSNNHWHKNWWDVHFIDNKFVVGNDVVQGIITDLGELELDSVNSKLETVKRLNDYEPKNTLAEIREQNKLLEKGFVLKGFTYLNSAVVNLNHAYVMRSTAYRLKDEPRMFFKAGADTGIDITTAFKVVGRETDGSVIILWKELKTELPRRVLDNTVGKNSDED